MKTVSQMLEESKREKRLTPSQLLEEIRKEEREMEALKSKMNTRRERIQWLKREYESVKRIEATKNRDFIEVYYDPMGSRGGRIGCTRARLKSNPRIHVAGTDEESAINDLLITLRSMGCSSNKGDYMIERIS